MLSMFGITITSLLLILSFFSTAGEENLIVTGSSTWQPFSFIDKEGKPAGVMVDFWRLYAKVNKANIDFHLLPLSHSLEYVKSNKNVIHGGLGYTQTRAKHLIFSYELPFSTYKASLFVRNNLPFDRVNKLSMAVVGVVEKSTMHDFLLARLPKENIKLFPSATALNDAAIRGEIDIFVHDLDSALYYMQTKEAENMFAPKQTLYTFPLHFTANRGSEDIVTTIEEGLNNLTQEDISAIYHKWFPKQALQQQKFSTLEIIAAVALLPIFISVLFFYHHQLKLCTEKLTSTLAALNDSTRRLKNITQADMLTGAKTRHQFFLELDDKRFSTTPYIVAVLSIDKLKHINEKYGQDVGDMVLRHLTHQLKLKFANNTYARLCGGEFAILFDKMDSKDAEKKMNQLYRNVITNSLYVDQQVIPIRISIGFARYPHDGKQGEVLVRIAGNRMRINKHSTDKLNYEYQKSSLLDHNFL